MWGTNQTETNIEDLVPYVIKKQHYQCSYHAYMSWEMLSTERITTAVPLNN